MISLAEIAKALECDFYGNGKLIFSSPSEPSSANIDQIAIAIDKKFQSELYSTKAKGAIINTNFNWKTTKLEGVIVTNQSKLMLSKLTKVFDELKKENESVNENSFISSSSKIGLNPNIGSYVIIKENSELGNNVDIENFVEIGKNVIIGNNCVIKSGTKISNNTKIGDNFICHQNVVIGSDGFSFHPQNEESILDRLKKDATSNKKFLRVSSVGTVEIGNDVEIGANSCIDKGTIKNTIIKSGTKLDNLVHIAHNVEIGYNCLICGQVGIAGSTLVEDNVVMGGQVGIADNLKIGNNSIIAGKTGVSANVFPKKFMMGNPAMEMKKNIASYMALRRLPKLQIKIKHLNKLIDEISSKINKKLKSNK
ncbi:MAG: UDP-3-O-(3-hydroxymyristoyl)glucosamine N-acyltransferase [Paracoccaceae bacterium]